MQVVAALALGIAALPCVVPLSGCRIGQTTATASAAPPPNGGPPRPPAGNLRSPFDVEARRAILGHGQGQGHGPAQVRPVPELVAPAIGEPIIDVEGVSFYTDAEKSVADPVLKAKNLAALKPLRAFVSDVVKLADAWLLSDPPQPAYAVLAVEALGSWAAAGALLGVVNRQGAFERKWTLGSLALGYLKVRDAPGIDPARRAAIEAWLARIAEAVQPEYERPELTISSNNHAYWAGMAVAAAGIACNRRSLFDWGIARARLGIAQVQADGILPLERDRRGLALHYHVFALAPLVMLAQMASANGIALYDEGNGAIGRLAARVIDGLADPMGFGRQVGAAQEISLPPRNSDLAWAEPYFARFREPRLGGWIAAARPLFDVRLGGDMTAAFGVSLDDKL